MNRNYLYFRHLIVGIPTLIGFVFFIIIIKIHYKIFKGKTPTLIYYPVSIIFLSLDIMYNWIFGTFIFLEWPQENLYTTRLSRHRNSNDINIREYAQHMCSILGTCDPNHFDKG